MIYAKRRRRRILLPLAVTALVAAPFSLTPDGRVAASAATCQDGTCCPELKSTCIIGDWKIADKYALTSGGSCPKSEAEPLPPAGE